jgi:YebC/PmpR family DNA-binding regulatory protein
MSGHSKWSTIKHKKAALDAKRGKIFTRIIKELTIAARLGGGDPAGNPRLRAAVAEAKANNMPADNIKRAIQKGTGELPGTSYEETTYEGYGPGGVAVFLEVLTDNKNRTTSEIRHLFSKHGGNLGETNSVGWMFEKRGHFVIPAADVSEEKLMEVILEAGADDLRQGDEEVYEVFSAASELNAIRDALERVGIPVREAKLIMEPTTTVSLEGKKAEQCLKLLEVLEDHDDVQNVYANLEVDDDSLAAQAS